MNRERKLTRLRYQNFSMENKQRDQQRVNSRRTQIICYHRKKVAKTLRKIAEIRNKTVREVKKLIKTAKVIGAQVWTAVMRSIDIQARLSQQSNITEGAEAKKSSIIINE